MPTDFYNVLGLTQNATSRQIRTRFLELARERHPDRFQGQEKEKAEAEFQAVTQAFNVLSDPARRRQFDAEQTQPQHTGGAPSSEAARIYLQRGRKAFRAGSHSEAVDNFRRATREDPTSGSAWHQLAAAGRSIPSLRNEVREAAEKSCEFEPMNGRFLRLAGEVYAEQGRHAQAAKYLRGALDLGEADPEVEAAFKASLSAAKGSS